VLVLFLGELEAGNIGAGTMLISLIKVSFVFVSGSEFLMGSSEGVFETDDTDDSGEVCLGVSISVSNSISFCSALTDSSEGVIGIFFDVLDMGEFDEAGDIDGSGEANFTGQFLKLWLM
jgi:hypothetical protein